MRVLFVSYGGGHITMCLPVIRALRERIPDCDISLIALTTAAKVARNAGESPLGYADFLKDVDLKVARYWGEVLLPGNEHPDVDRAESVAYLGLNFIEWIDAFGEVDALRRWQSIGRHGFFPIRFFRRVLTELKPDIVVTTNSPRSEQAAIEAALALNIPCLSMVDLFGLSGDPFLVRSKYADVITVLSLGVRDNLLRAGITSSRIVVTGNPALDELSKPSAVTRGLGWRTARGWEGKHVVLWAGYREPLDADPKWAGTALGDAVVERLSAWIQHREDLALVIRYHPNEWPDFSRPPVHPRIHWSEPGKEDLIPVLMGADQVVVQCSTVGLQAYIAGKRLVSLVFSPWVQRFGLNYANLGMGVGCGSLDQLESVLELGLVAGQYKDIEKTPNAAAKVVTQIEELIRSRMC